MVPTTQSTSIQSIVGAQLYDESHQKTKQKPAPLVTVSRGFGANGSRIARRLADRLQVRYFDRELLRDAAQEAQADAYLMELLDERVTNVIEDTVRNFFTRYSSKDDFYRAMIKVILGISRSGGGVIVGRGAHLLLPHHKSFRLRVNGSLGECTERVSKRLGIRFERAKELVEKTNADRSRYVRRIYERYSTQNTYYDMVVSSDLFTPDQAADVAIDALEKVGFAVPPQP